MNMIDQKTSGLLHGSAFHLADITDYRSPLSLARSLYIFLKDGSFSSIGLVRQSLKLCQNASYPGCHPDLNNLAGDKTQAERRHGLWVALPLRRQRPGPSCLPKHPPLYQLWQVPIKPSLVQGRGGRGRQRHMKCSGTIAPGGFAISVWSGGKQVSSFFASNLRLTIYLFL